MITNRYLSAARNRTMQQFGKRFFPGHYLTTTPLHTHGMPVLGSSDDINGRQLVNDKPNWRGYNNLYYWSYLEPEEGVYDFSKILEDLDRTAADGKVMGISVEDRAYSTTLIDPLPAYLGVDPIYEGGWYRPGTGIFPKLWVPAIGDRMAALLQAMGDAVDSHPALSVVTFQETAVHDITLQQGYDATEYFLYLKKLNSAASAAFPRTVVAQIVNWFAGMSQAQGNELISHIVNTCHGGFGSTDIIASNQGGTVTPVPALNTNFGNLGIYDTYRGVAPIVTRAETPTYYGSDDPQVQFDYAMDTMGAHMVLWQPIRGIAHPVLFTIHDVIDVVDQENGRTNTTTPTTLLNATE